MGGNLECMKVLISNGSDINEKNNRGSTPFDLLSKENKIKIKEYIAYNAAEEDPLLVKGVVEDE